MKYFIVLALVGSTALAASPFSEGFTKAWTVNPFYGKTEPPIQGKAEVIGSPTRGCVIGAKPLTSIHNKCIRPLNLDRHAHYGHPSTLQLIDQFGKSECNTKEVKECRQQLITDLSLSRGGPMRERHKSHNNGLDFDMLYKTVPCGHRSSAINDDTDLGFNKFEKIGKEKDGRVRFRQTADVFQEAWDKEGEGNLVRRLRKLAESPNVNRVLVNPVIKRRLCELSGVWGQYGKKRAYPKGQAPKEYAWLSKVRVVGGHMSHTHVRLNCPKDSPDCIGAELSYYDDEWGLGCNVNKGPLAYHFAGQESGTKDILIDPNSEYKAPTTRLAGYAQAAFCKESPAARVCQKPEPPAEAHSAPASTATAPAVEERPKFICRDFKIKDPEKGEWTKTSCVPEACAKIFQMGLENSQPGTY